MMYKIMLSLVLLTLRLKDNKKSETIEVKIYVHKLEVLNKYLKYSTHHSFKIYISILRSFFKSNKSLFNK